MVYFRVIFITNDPFISAPCVSVVFYCRRLVSLGRTTFRGSYAHLYMGEIVYVTGVFEKLIITSAVMA